MSAKSMVTMALMKAAQVPNKQCRYKEHEVTAGLITCCSGGEHSQSAHETYEQDCCCYSFKQEGRADSRVHRLVAKWQWHLHNCDLTEGASSFTTPYVVAIEAVKEMALMQPKSRNGRPIKRLARFD